MDDSICTPGAGTLPPVLAGRDGVLHTLSPALNEAAPLWATEDGGSRRVEWVCTAQSFEEDWSGVLLDPHLVWRDGRSTSDRAARDPAGTAPGSATRTATA